MRDPDPHRGNCALTLDDLNDASDCLIAGDRAIFCRAHRRTVGNQDLGLRFQLGASTPESSTGLDRTRQVMQHPAP